MIGKIQRLNWFILIHLIALKQIYAFFRMHCFSKNGFEPFMLMLIGIRVFVLRFMCRRPISILVGSHSKLRKFLLLLLINIMRSICLGCWNNRLVLRRNLYHRQWFISRVIAIRFNPLNKLVSHRPIILHDIFRRSSFIVVDLQTHSYELFVMLAELDVGFKELVNRGSCYLFEQNRLNLFFPRQVAVYHFIGNYS